MKMKLKIIAFHLPLVFVILFSTGLNVLVVDVVKTKYKNNNNQAYERYS